MNQTIEQLLSHRSIRKFKDKDLTNEQIQTIVKAASQASTSSHMMAYTIMGITDPKIKKELASISGQHYVENNAHLFVFLGDLHRATLLASDADQEAMQESMESTEQFIVATIDAALAAQNAAIAAESLGLGICYIGSLRNDINRVNELLNLPSHVVPYFGMVVGYPDDIPEVKPRLPIEALYHENTYLDDVQHMAFIKQFDHGLNAYYQNRTTNKRMDHWSDLLMNKLKKVTRMDVTPFIKNKKLNRR